MAVGDAVRQEDAVLAARRFLDAFNERDLAAMEALVAEDVELRVRELIGPDDVERTADFVIRDGHVASFALRPIS